MNRNQLRNVGYTSYDNRPLTHRYLDIIQTLVQSVPKVKTWIDAKTDNDFVWLRGQLAPPAPRVIVHNNADLKQTVVHVEGAGVQDVNGTYVYHSIHLGGGVYKKSGSYQGKSIDYTLYKCNMTSGGVSWFISIVPPTKNPGTNDDIDFYVVPSAYSEYQGRNSERTPPEGQWSTTKGAHTMPPGPTITVSLETSEDSDREDSLAAVEDDRSSSVPDTPIPDSLETPESP